MYNGALQQYVIYSLALALAVAALPTLAAPGETELVSVSIATNHAAGESYMEGTQSVSADGRFVAFTSKAPDLVWGDTNGKTDVFVRDRLTGTTERVSVGSDGSQGDRESVTPSISADGRYVAFISAATLPPHSGDGSFAVFVRDRSTGQTESVSTRPGIGPMAIISADGRFVTYSGSATATTFDVLVYDRLLRTTEPVSDAPFVEGAESLPCAISADGRFLAYSSLDPNVVTGDTNGFADIFVRDRLTTQTSRVSVASGGEEANSTSERACSISADGRFVGFFSFATNLVQPDTGLSSGALFVHDRQAGITELVSVDPNGRARTGHGISLSADGRYVAFDAFSNNVGAPGIFVRDRQMRLTQTVALPANGAGIPVPGRSPSISADGRFIAFETQGSNLVTNDPNGAQDVFIHERADPSFGFALKPTAVIFGNQALASSTTMSFWLTNKGTAPLPITGVGIVGVNPAMFSVDNRCGSSVAVGASCSFRVTFRPTSVGDKSAKLRVVAGDNDVRTKALSGTGVASAFSVSPTSLDFGSVPINTTTAPRFVTISNTGSAVLPISSITLAGWNPYQFTQTHNCPANLAVGNSCTVNVIFKPTTPIGSKAALLNITPGGGAAIRSVALAGAAR
jgi:Tol biopolymer transport system component